MFLAASELVTNALRHGEGTCTLDRLHTPTPCEVAVHDPNRHAPLNGATEGFVRQRI